MQTPLTIDLNCDMGESLAAEGLGVDAHLLDHVTSANIACGFHAGDPATMRATVRLAVQKGVAIGAHPGFRDLAGFGRRRMDLSSQEVQDIVLYQVGALHAFAVSEGTALRHVKPHGALYNMAAKDAQLADAIADAVYHFDPKLILVGLSGSELIRSGNARGLRTASEVFADRTYQDDGSLTPRDQPGAMVHDANVAAGRVVKMIREGKVESVSGNAIPIVADTVCIHGDSPSAVEFARMIRQELHRAGITVAAIKS